MAKLGSHFGKLFGAASVSNLGDGIMVAALPLLVAELTRDPMAVAGSTIAATLPWFLLALFAGAVADRVNRRTAMMSADILRGVVVAGLATAVLTDTLSLPIIYVAAFAIGSAETLFDSASEAFLPSLLPDEQLSLGNARLQGVEWATNSFVGPPIGAFLFGAAAALPFYANAVSFIVAALLIGLIPRSYGTPRFTTTENVRDSISEGIRFLLESRVLRTLSFMAGITNIFLMAVVATFVLFAQDILEVMDAGYGVMLGALGLGGLAGALLAPWVSTRLGPGTTIQATVVLQTVLIVLFGLNSNKWVAGGVLTVWGSLVTAWNVIAVTLRQSLTPDRLRGRVSSASRLIAWGAQPFGALLGGALASWLGLRAPYLVAGAAWAAMFVLTLPIVNDKSIAAARERTAAAAEG